MKYFKYLKSSILGKKIFVILTIVQVAVIGVVSMELANSFYKLTYKEQDLAKNTNVDIEKVCQLTIYGDKSNVRNFMNKVESKIKVGSYYYSNHYYEKENRENESKVLEIDENMYELLEAKIVKGRGFEKRDFGREGMKSILISEKYIDQFELNEVLELTFDEDIKLEVVGFFKENIKWLPNQDVEDVGLNELSDYIVGAFTKKDIEDVSFYDMTGSTTYVVNEKGDINKIREEIERINKEYNYNVEVLSIRERIDRNREDVKPLIMQDMFFLIFVTISALIGLVLNILWTISIRKKEFGTRIAVGFNVFNIQKLLIIENVIIGSIGAIIGMGITYNKLLESVEFLKIGGLEMVILPNIQILFVFIAIIIIISMTSYFATMGLNKISVKDMIGCDE
ncbi:MAG: ABC transporter permease [Romboutsia sp.]|uniref:ABC transporter permease n=1 Tax=Romboutsia sp. TaxID=1965302 RepID=UPI003F342D93